MEFGVGKHDLKNEWILTVSEYESTYTIEKPGIYGIWATRVTGGQWGDGIWTLRLLNGEEENYETIAGGFSLDDCNNVVDIMECLVQKYKIENFRSQDTKNKADRTKAKGLFQTIKHAICKGSHK